MPYWRIRRTRRSVEGLKQKLLSKQLQAGAALAKAKAEFKAKVNTMTNTITANQKAYERGCGM